MRGADALAESRRQSRPYPDDGLVDPVDLGATEAPLFGAARWPLRISDDAYPRKPFTSAANS
jgi:hypothetical protein